MSGASSLLPARLCKGLPLKFALVCAAMALLQGCTSASLGDISTRTTGAVGGLFASKPPVAPKQIQMFVASTRKGERGASTEAASDGHARYSLQTVSVPPGHTPGVIERPSFGSENPKRHFVIAGRRALASDEFQNELSTHLAGRSGNGRDVLVFIHGFNNSYDEARLRLTQIVADSNFAGVPVLFTWPSRSSMWAYGSDKESATVARDALSDLLNKLANTPGIGRVNILAHSMGTWLTMETLRESAIAGNPELGGHLGNVMLAAPDIDLVVFRQQVARLDTSKISIFVSRGDRALSVSRTLAGDRQRVGGMDPSNATDRSALDRLGVKVYDLSGESSGFIGHAAFADAPSAIRNIAAQLSEPRVQDAAPQAAVNEPAPSAAQAQATPPANPGPVIAQPLAPVEAAALPKPQ